METVGNKNFPIYGEILILRSPIINYRDHSTINSHDIMRHARAQCTCAVHVRSARALLWLHVCAIENDRQKSLDAANNNID